jgi:hypothetical protein
MYYFNIVNIYVQQISGASKECVPIIKCIGGVYQSLFQKINAGIHTYAAFCNWYSHLSLHMHFNHQQVASN